MTLPAAERAKKAIDVLTHHRAERDLEVTPGGTTVIVRIWAGSKYTGFNANVLRRLLELEPLSIELHQDATLHIWFWPEGHEEPEEDDR